MKPLLSTRLVKVSAVLVLSSIVGLLAMAWYFHIWSWRDFQVYQAMSQECHPVWRDLHWGSIQSGHDVEQVITATEPVRVERYGEFVQLSYQKGLCFTGVTIMAKRGRVASAAAWSCTWSRTFFDELTQEDMTAYNEAYEKHWRPIREKP